MKYTDTLLEEALRFGSHMCHLKKDKFYDPSYGYHPLDVAANIEKFGIKRNTDEGEVLFIAALLYRTPKEDAEGASKEILEDKFGAEIAYIITALNSSPENSDEMSLRRKIIDLDWKVRMVMVAIILTEVEKATESIKREGLSEVQKNFNRSLAERISMESNFFSSAVQDGDPESLKKMVEAAKGALFGLGLACSSHSRSKKAA